MPGRHDLSRQNRPDTLDLGRKVRRAFHQAGSSLLLGSEVLLVGEERGLPQEEVGNLQTPVDDVLQEALSETIQETEKADSCEILLNSRGLEVSLPAKDQPK